MYFLVVHFCNMIYVLRNIYVIDTQLRRLTRLEGKYIFLTAWNVNVTSFMVWGNLQTPLNFYTAKWLPVSTTFLHFYAAIFKMISLIFTKHELPINCLRLYRSDIWKCLLLWTIQTIWHMIKDFGNRSSYVPVTSM